MKKIKYILLAVFLVITPFSFAQKKRIQPQKRVKTIPLCFILLATVKQSSIRWIGYKVGRILP